MSKIEKLLTGWLSESASAARRGLAPWPGDDARYVALDLNAALTESRREVEAVHAKRIEEHKARIEALAESATLRRQILDEVSAKTLARAEATDLRRQVEEQAGKLAEYKTLGSKETCYCGCIAHQERTRAEQAEKERDEWTREFGSPEHIRKMADRFRAAAERERGLRERLEEVVKESNWRYKFKDGGSFTEASLMDAVRKAEKFLRTLPTPPESEARTSGGV